ncbi:MAG TPA: electron transport complex subunit RsxB [Woeseiaceae bacterium]|nr:electron transport complex subunit RsxB [Woeseiaceae bacterium]
MWISIATAVSTITGIALASGLLLGYVSRRLPGNSDGLVERVNELLPQTQCAQCGYPGCRPYAAAIVDGGAAINLCPPGGDDTVRRLAAMLDREALPVTGATSAASVHGVAIIDESLCIGCAWCRDACPVDAITGARNFMHTVIASECTGCELCVARCPVNCISMVS